MKKLRFALFGCGFWARFQLQGWKELEGVECVAVFNRTRSKAEQFARDLEVPAVYDDAAELLQREKPDFVDIVTNPTTFSRFVELAASRGIPAICQKPMAPSVAVAEKMVRSCREAKVPFFIHENWRWQTTIRQFKQVLASGEIGLPFRARIRMVSGFPVFKNEPTLNKLEHFILTDMGTHILDVARFLFGESQTIYCQIHRVHPDIKGEDVATVMMLMGSQTTVVCELGYAENYLENDAFPQTLIFVEGEKGSAELAQDYWIRVTTSTGTHSRRFPPRHYAWADPDYLVVHSSIVPCNANLLQALRGEGQAETTAEDNLKTIILTFAAYESARTGETISL